MSGRRGKRTPLYRYSKDISRYVLAQLGKQMLGLTSTAVKSAGVAAPPARLDPFVADEFVSAVSGDSVVLSGLSTPTNR